MNPNKRVCIVLVKDMQEGQDPDNIIKAGDRVMRTTLSFATQMIATGYWNYCSKGKLKSFLNKNAKLTRNMRTLEAMQNIIGSNLPEKRLAGKTIIICPTFKVVHSFEGDRLKRDSKTFNKTNQKTKLVDTGTKILVVAYPQG